MPFQKEVPGEFRTRSWLPSLSLSVARGACRQAAKVLSGCEIVVATPGRLLEFAAAGVCPLDRVTLLVLSGAAARLHLSGLDLKRPPPTDEADALLSDATLGPRPTPALGAGSPPLHWFGLGWGGGGWPQVKAVVECLRPDRQTLMFSATWLNAVPAPGDRILHCDRRICQP
jgi:superfamily II DNA/RNA helicase